MLSFAIIDWFFLHFLSLFSRHRCPHGPTTDETTTVFDEVTNTETLSAYRKDFIDNKMTNYEVIRTPAKKPVDNLKPEGDIEFLEKVPFRPAERVVATKPQDNLFVSGEFQGIYHKPIQLLLPYIIINFCLHYD